jgi:hypothetical protein
MFLLGGLLKSESKVDAGDDSFLQVLLKDLDDDPLKKKNESEERPRPPQKKSQKRSLADVAVFGNMSEGTYVFPCFLFPAPDPQSFFIV